MDNQVMHFNESMAIAEILFDNRPRASIQTNQEYKSRIHLFLHFLQENPNLQQDEDLLLHYKRYLEKFQQYTVSTKNKYFIAAKVFLQELARKGHLQRDITSGISGFQENKLHKKDGLTDEEIKLLFHVIREIATPNEKARIQAIVSLLVYQGLREIELVRIKVENILNNGTIKILGKGRDDYEIIYLNPETVRALETYIDCYHLRSGYLFFSTSNNKSKGQIDTRSIRMIITNIFKQIGITKNVHCIRHYFATKVVRNFENPLEAIRFTRHRSLQMLNVYYDKEKVQTQLPKFFSAFKTE